MEDVEFNTRNLDQFIKALKDNMSRARVGVLGNKTMRKTSSIDNGTNATIGAMHEYGTEKLPIRSFLRVPIADNLEKKMENSEAFNKEELEEVVKQGSVVPWLKKIAVLAEGIVAEAFETQGFGKWPAWKNGNYKNGGNSLLVDTGQLRDSITSEVK
jgi:phage gpG-like protein